MQVGTPQTPKAFERYYRLRWEVLRAPWGQPLGSERDDLDASSIHVAIEDGAGATIAVGRLHFNTPAEAQIRYMAVHPGHRQRGMGSAVLQALERHAWEGGAQAIVLHARETAIGFYQRHGYHTVAPSHTLYGEIAHVLMQKVRTSPAPPL